MIAIFPELVAAASTKSIDKLAVLVRHYFGGDNKFKPICDVPALLTGIDIPVRTMPMQDFGALVAKDEKGTFEIAALQATGLDPIAGRFLWAHLLGHYFLHVQADIARGELNKTGFREAVCPLTRYCHGGMESHLSAHENRMENEADMFAAALLLPQGMLLKAVAQLGDDNRVAHFFGVTKACVRRRMDEITGSEESPANFLAAENRLPTSPHESAAPAEDPTRDREAPPHPEPPIAMPRSVAAKSYGHTAKTTARSPQSQKPTAESAKAGGGMARIRELAKQIDPSVDS